MYQAKQLAALAQSQSIEAANIIQRRGVNTDDDKFQESLALSLANLSQSFHEFLKDQS